ncbi:helix-hairpin-helix domain-containing protein [Streptomyces sp. NPDC047928]|uniref:helix-hairpin-helix domain-containing protein n=1 Tax=unclassified Streptomyces TaxID=2593676 RepID=UPI003711B94B
MASALRRRADALLAGTDPPPTPLAARVAAEPTRVEPERVVPTRVGPVHGGEGLREGRTGWWSRMPLWLRLRCGMEPRTLAALTVVLAVAAVLAGRYFWTGRPEPVRPPDIVGHAEPATMATGRPRAQPSPPGVVVDVGGKVRKPGVVRLPAGSRVADALHAAGGVRPGTDLTGLNRARVLMDGEHVLVGVPAAAQPAGVPGASGGRGQGAPPALVSLNSATAEELDTLPGVGPVLAQHILDHRAEHGGFRSVAELREVKGIGDRRFAELQPLVRP